MADENSMKYGLLGSFAIVGLLLGGCRARGGDSTAAGRMADSSRAAGPTAVIACAPDNAGLALPAGFCATVLADSIGHARHLTVSSDGTVYVNTWSGEYYGNDKPHAGGFLVALRDTTGDGRADVIARFGDSVQGGGHGGTGIALYKGALYAESNDKILRYTMAPGSVTPAAAPEVIIESLPLSGDHPMHPFAMDSSGGLYMSSGSASNACQVKNRVKGSPGRDPCTELETRGGIWRYDPNQTGQHFSPRERFATGIRNAVGIGADASGQVYSTQHGRDQLAENWPKLYTPVQGQNFPSEVLLKIEKGADFGWPYCYFDSTQVKLVLAPEYGGDGGKATGDCASKQEPTAYFPAHWGPNALAFYNAGNFPAAYRGGVFIAFHGSWNRAPGPQGGYNIVFVPFAGGKPSGPPEIYADGFAGARKEPGKAAHRPSGLAVGPDGALYISDDVGGRIWRVVYGGPAVPAPSAGVAPAPAAAAAPSAVVSLSAAAKAAGITPAMVALGDSIFHGQVANGTCTACHGSDATGTPLAPDLTDNKWLWSDGSYQSIVKTIKEGVPAPKEHRGVMPPMGGAQLTPAQLSAVGAYVFALSHPT